MGLILKLWINIIRISVKEAQEKAIQSLFGNDNSISDRGRIEKVLMIIDGLEDKNEALLKIEKVLRT